MTDTTPAIREAVVLGYQTMTALELATPFFLVAVLAGVGAWSASVNRCTFLRLLQRGFLVSMLVLVPGTIWVAWFVFFDPDSINGIATGPSHQLSWILSMAVFGAGLSLLAGVAAYGLGGLFSGILRSDRSERLIIAIDGPAASGKGTLAKRVAERYGLAWLDTGLLYRAVARDVAAKGGKLDDAQAAMAAALEIKADSLSDPGLRGPRAGDDASVVAKIPEVRAALLCYQRAFARHGKGAVLDGRDIGTIVCPDADVKIFVTASDETRAKRRHLEHQARGEDVTCEQILDDLRRRDARDSSRPISPLKPAADAIVLDTTNLNADQAFDAALKAIEERLARTGPAKI